MQHPLHAEEPPPTVPSFYLTGRQPLRPAAILLAIAVAFGALSSVLFALGHAGVAHLVRSGHDTAASPNSGAAPPTEEKDDPDQIDTIVLGDPTDAPVPGRRGDHVSPVHPTIIVHLPREGPQVGLIPNTPAGHLLYNWLAAFNHQSVQELRNALPSAALDATVELQIELRRQTGGYNLLSAKEVQRGVLVFRLRDQTPAANEVLGTLQVSPDSMPAAIESFSLRAVSPGPATVGQPELLRSTKRQPTE